MLLIRKIKENLTPDLLTPYWREKATGPMDGHCYVATECFYYLYGKDNGWKPKCYRDDEGDIHWWCKKDGIILDITGEQFDNYEHYDKGHGQAFMAHPSKRCRELARRIEKWENM